jgi:hypothetical protein
MTDTNKQKRSSKEGTCLEGKTAYEEMLIALKLVKGLHDQPYKENPQWKVILDPMAYRQVSEAIERAEIKQSVTTMTITKAQQSIKTAQDRMLAIMNSDLPEYIRNEADSILFLLHRLNAKLLAINQPQAVDSGVARRIR